MGFVLFLIGIYIAVGVGAELQLKQGPDEKLELSLDALKRVFTWPKIVF